MKYLKACTIALALFIATLASATSTYALECGDWDSRGRCGEEVSCPAGAICNITGWGTGECVPSPDRCNPNIIDHSMDERCGATNNTATWCGVSGGCADGYVCTSSGVCKEEAGCANTSNIYNTMCGKSFGTRNSCGEIGGCADNYRCVSVSSTESGTGYACLNAPDKNGVYCDGTTGAEMPIETKSCDQTTINPNDECNCAAVGDALQPLGSNTYCCGYARGGECYPSQEDYNASVDAGEDTSSGEDPLPSVDAGDDGGSDDGGEDPETPVTEDENGESDDNFSVFQGPNSQDFADLNPLADSAYVGDLSSPGGIISRIMLFAFPIAGLILFLMLVWAGFEILSKAPSGKSIDAGKQRATAAIAGFILLFCTYWIMQIIEYVFGIVIL